MSPGQSLPSGAEDLTLPAIPHRRKSDIKRMFTSFAPWLVRKAVRLVYYSHTDSASDHVRAVGRALAHQGDGGRPRPDAPARP